MNQIDTDGTANSIDPDQTAPDLIQHYMSNPFCPLDPEDQCGQNDYMSLIVRKLVLEFPTWSGTNRAVQLQKKARDVKFCI